MCSVCADSFSLRYCNRHAALYWMQSWLAFHADWVLSHHTAVALPLPLYVACKTTAHTVAHAKAVTASRQRGAIAGSSLHVAPVSHPLLSAYSCKSGLVGGTAAKLPSSQALPQHILRCCSCTGTPCPSSRSNCAQVLASGCYTCYMPVWLH